MKLIKKLTTILFAFMMVLSATTMVFAADTGKITIDNAIPGQEYKIYKILGLESYDSANNLYAYELTDHRWDNFVETDTVGSKYLQFVDKDKGIVKKKTEFTDDTAKDFAKAALVYANTNSITVTDTKTAPAATGGATTSTVEFTGLGMGYYLVDSSAGVLCSLNTLSNDVIIQEKNTVPTVKKEVSLDGVTYTPTVSSNIFDSIFVKVTITVGAGAQNYVLHDRATTGLNIDTNSIKVEYDGVEKNVNDFYTVRTTTLESAGPCTFHIEFLKNDELVVGKEIVVTYTAHLTENAEVSTNNNINTAWVVYGEKNAKSNESTAIVKTYKIPLYKYGKNVDNNVDSPLAGAKFKLNNGTEDVKLIKVDDNTYRRAKINELMSAPTEFVTPTDGKITINYLNAGTYYLEEIETPKGYNKLKNPIEITIDNDGGVTYKEKGTAGGGTNITSTDNLVKIENKTGTVLPSTGGMGTTMMYIVGAALLIGSGVMLITKKNAK